MKNTIFWVEVFFFFLCFFSFYGCHPDKEKPLSSEDLNFELTEASRIYFKNVRQSDYEVEEIKNAGIDVFTPRDLDSMILSPRLVVNWRHDRCFFMLHSPLDAATVKVGSKADTSATFEAGNQRNHAYVGLYIYNGILNQDSIFILQGKTNWVPLYTSASETETFRRTFFDFLRLTEVR